MSELKLSCPRCAGQDWDLVLGESNQWRCLSCLWVSRIGDEGVMELVPERSEKPLDSPDDRRATLSDWAPALEWAAMNRAVNDFLYRGGGAPHAS